MTSSTLITSPQSSHAPDARFDLSQPFDANAAPPADQVTSVDAKVDIAALETPVIEDLGINAEAQNDGSYIGATIVTAGLS